MARWHLEMLRSVGRGLPNSGNKRKENNSRPARLDLEVFWGKLNNMEMVNAIMAIVIYAVYPGYLVLKNDNKIQIFYI